MTTNPTTTTPGPVTVDAMVREVIHARAAAHDANAAAAALLQQSPAGSALYAIGVDLDEIVHSLGSGKRLAPGAPTDHAEQAAARLAVRATLRDDGDVAAWMAAAAAALHTALDAAARHRRAAGLLRALADILV
jgi:tRNA(Arg) A34 adenosine deaminase TadA